MSLLQNIKFVLVGKPLLSRFPNRERQAGTKGVPFCPGSGNRDKKHPFVSVSNTNRDKRCCQRHVPGTPFCPGWCYQPGQKDHFFSVPLFSIVFLFRLYFYISIKLMYWNSVCKISTNIYIYIVIYIIFVLDSFHI